MRSIVITRVPLSALPRDGEVQSNDLVANHAYFGQLNGKQILSHAVVQVENSLVFTFVVENNWAV